jgi:threonine/homoserine/homoserine lactone efflux protein
MPIHSLIQGIGIGILVSAPLGPIGVLVIQKTLNKGKTSGLITGFGAASADIFYAIIAAFGVAIITNFLQTYQSEIRLIGGVVLMFFAYHTFTTNVLKQFKANIIGKKNFLADYFSTFFLTASNPVPFIVFGISFASLDMSKKNIYDIMIIVLGIIAGAVLWWIFLVSIINAFRHKFRLKQLWWVNKITGVLIALFSIFIVLSVFFNITP